MRSGARPGRVGALLAVADLAGGTWPERARDAAEQLSGSAEVEDASLGIPASCRLSGRLRRARRLWTRDLLDRLYGIEEAPWGEWEISPKRLADLLRPYGVSSRTIRIGNKTAKGYRRGISNTPGAAISWRIPALQT